MAECPVTTTPDVTSVAYNDPVDRLQTVIGRTAEFAFSFR